jgi:hypothetical protein
MMHGLILRQTRRHALRLEISHDGEDEETPIEHDDTVQLQDVLHAQRVDGEDGLPDVAKNEEAEVDGDDERSRYLVGDGIDPVEVG